MVLEHIFGKGKEDLKHFFSHFLTGIDSEQDENIVLKGSYKNRMVFN